MELLVHAAENEKYRGRFHSLMYITKEILLGFHSRRCLFSVVIASTFLFLILNFPNSMLLITGPSYSKYRDRYYLKEQTCTPKSHIMFLKIHKCASSTIQNIFLRYGYKNNLTFALAKNGNYLGHPAKFQPQYLDKSLVPPSGLVDIFCLHTRYNKNSIQKVLHPDTVWIASIRNPVEQFESSFIYFGLEKIYNTKLEDFSKVPKETLTNITRKLGRFGNNQMLFDFGVNENISISDLRQNIEEFDQRFDLVMIAERLEESLVLLRHKLCWRLEDVVFFTKNARRKKNKLSPLTIKRIKEINSADEILYDHFLLKHEKMVSEFGKERMQREVLELKEYIRNIYDNCVASEVSGRDSRLPHKEYSPHVTGYLLKNESSSICEPIVIAEIPFIERIRQKQKEILTELYSVKR